MPGGPPSSRHGREEQVVVVVHEVSEVGRHVRACHEGVVRGGRLF